MNRRPLFFFSPDQGNEVPASALESNPPLFFVEAQEREELAERNGRFTGDRFFSQRPGEYAECVRLLGAGASAARIAEALGCSRNTVREVRRREGFTVEQARAKTVSALSEFVADAADRLRDEVDTVPIDKLAIPFGIATEKLQLLTGGATARVELVIVSPADEFADYINALPSAMGLGAEESGQKAEGSPIPATGNDTQSLDLPAASEGIEATATHCATPGRASGVVGDDRQGGAGVDFSPPPPSNPIHLSERDSGTKSQSNSDEP